MNENKKIETETETVAADFACYCFMLDCICPKDKNNE